MNEKRDFQILFPEFLDEETDELIQIISPEDGEEISDDSIPQPLPILPIRNTVLFPGVMIPITVGRQKSTKLVKKAYKGDRIIGVVAQKNIKIEDFYK